MESVLWRVCRILGPAPAADEMFRKSSGLQELPPTNVVDNSPHCGDKLQNSSDLRLDREWKNNGGSSTQCTGGFDTLSCFIVSVPSALFPLSAYWLNRRPKRSGVGSPVATIGDLISGFELARLNICRRAKQLSEGDKLSLTQRGDYVTNQTFEGGRQCVYHCLSCCGA